MADTRKLLDLTVDEYRQLFFPDRSASFSGGANVVVDTPPPPAPPPAPTYKWACQLIGLPAEVRQLYASDEEIRVSYFEEKAEGFPDAFRKRFFRKG